MGVTSFDAFRSREFGPFVHCLLVAQLWLTVCDPMDCSPPGSSLHGILQARTVEQVAISFSRVSSQAQNQPSSPALQADSLQLSHLGSLRKETSTRISPLCFHKKETYSKCIRSVCMPKTQTQARIFQKHA